MPFGLVRGLVKVDGTKHHKAGAEVKVEDFACNPQNLTHDFFALCHVRGCHRIEMAGWG